MNEGKSILASNHTPGPWQASGHHIYGPKHYESRHVNGRVLVGEVVRGNHRADPHLDGGADCFGFDSKADVALIASAPCLLEAAHKAMLFIETSFQEDVHELEVYSVLRKAIAKAVGNVEKAYD